MWRWSNHTVRKKKIESIHTYSVIMWLCLSFYVYQIVILNMYHYYFQRNVYGSQLNLTLEGKIIYDTIYNLIVHFKCLFHFFLKNIKYPSLFFIMELVNEQNNRQLTMQIQLTCTNWTDICKCLITSKISLRGNKKKKCAL